MQEDTPKSQQIVRSVEAARTSNACLVCREKKVKCSGEQPCSYCSKRSLDCVFSRPGKRRLTYFPQIHASQETVLSPQVQTSDAPVNNIGPQNQIRNSYASPTTSSASYAHASLPWLNQIGTGHVGQVPGGPSPSSTRPARVAPESALSSSETFGSEVRMLLVSGSVRASAISPSDSMSAIESWPTQDEANSLLEVVVLNVGISQQLFDVRTFADNMALVYTDPPSQVNLPELLIVEMCLVFAVGRLLRAKDDDNGDLPGTALFKQAMQRMPMLTELRQYCLLGIEVAALAALYLQVTDRKNDAYLYSSTALRLAISHGLHQVGKDISYRSEIIHRNRLWWSVYMQERRLCAACGYPMSINDQAITASPPFEAPGYQSSTALSINMRTAQITGRIVSTIYSQDNKPESEFITDVQSILRTLNDIEKTMPAEYSMQFERARLLVAGRPFAEAPLITARTSSGLYISVFSAVMHAARPVLLYMARHSRNSSDETSLGAMSPSLVRLAEICVETCSKTLAILKQLRERELLAKHAFLDLDATFSVGFIFVLVEAIHPGKHLGLQGIDECRTILRYLARLGNRAAASRLAELDHMCANLSTPIRPPTGSHSSPQNPLDFATLMQPFSFTNGYGSFAETPNYSATAENRLGGNTSPATSRTEPIDARRAELCSADLASLPLAGEDALYAAYHPPGLTFTGVEQADWEIIENELFQGV